MINSVVANTLATMVTLGNFWYIFVWCLNSSVLRGKTYLLWLPPEVFDPADFESDVHFLWKPKGYWHAFWRFGINFEALWLGGGITSCNQTWKFMYLSIRAMWRNSVVFVILHPHGLLCKRTFDCQLTPVGAKGLRDFEQICSPSSEKSEVHENCWQSE